MIYILNYGDRVRLGGTVANYNMLAEGWVPYHGPIPIADELRLVDGVLVPVEKSPEVSPDL